MMLANEAVQKIAEFMRNKTDGVEFDEIDDKFNLLINPIAHITSEDDFDKMFVGPSASVRPLCHKKGCRYFLIGE